MDVLEKKEKMVEIVALKGRKIKGTILTEIAPNTSCARRGGLPNGCRRRRNGLWPMPERPMPV
jgi:hypothetical protein